MRPAGVLFMGCTIPDVAVNDNQRRAILRILESAQRPSQHLQVIGISDPRHIPAIADKTRGHVFRESQSSVSFNGDAVIVVNPAEIREPQMAGERRRFPRDAFHHATISAEGVYVEVEQLLGNPWRL